MTSADITAAREISAKITKIEIALQNTLLTPARREALEDSLEELTFLFLDITG